MSTAPFEGENPGATSVTLPMHYAINRHELLCRLSERLALNLEEATEYAKSLTDAQLAEHLESRAREGIDNWPGSEMGPPERQPLVAGVQGRTASSIGWNAMALMGMFGGVGLVALAFNYRWLTMALGVAVIVVAMVASIAMPDPAKSKHIDTRG